MSALNNSLLLGQEGAGGYAISRSVRLNSADSAYFSRTPASAGNRKTWTWAGWVKGIATARFFSAGVTVSNDTAFGIRDQVFDCFNRTGGSINCRLITTSFYRDPSAWFHVVFVWNTTSSTASDRAQIWVNGSRITNFSTATYPPQNTDSHVNNTVTNYVGSQDLTEYFAGLLADIHFIDGQALDPTSFGEFSATTGVWMPKAYTGTYGTNGFHLDFSNNASAAALGTDTSGNGNTWSVNNISVTAGAGNDSLVDVPTNGSEVDTGSGGQVRGNYATWNPLDNNTKSTGGNGNLEAVITGADALYGNIRATHGISEKTYWETVVAGTSRTYQYHGIAPSDSSLVASGSGGIGYTNVANSVGVYCQDGTVYVSGSSVLTQSLSITTGDILMHAYDPLSGKYWAGRNGTWFNSGNPAAGTGQVTTLSTAKQWMPAVSSASTQTITANFGQRPFAYTAPSGFKALCTSNLPAPVVTKPSDVMDVKLYPGNGSTQTISGFGFSPDFVWLKNRSAGDYHRLNDIIRGANRHLFSNTTDAEVVNDANGYLSAFTSDGFSLTSGTGVNASGNSYVAWCWDAGSSTVTNTQGSISSQVRANASAGFSVVTYTGTGSAATVGHGLGVAPQMIIVKSRGSVTNWGVGHTSIGWANALRLNTTDASSAQATFWNSTAPTSTVFSVGTGPSTNNNGDSIVAYCFAPVAGYSAFGSYTGNGSADGPFVWTGHRVRWLLIKHSSASGDNWWLLDSAREEYNDGNRTVLFPNTSGAEVTDANPVDFLSNGFKPRNSGSGTNASGETYIYAAFAESPFQYARAR